MLDPRSLGLTIMPGQKALGLPTMFSAKSGHSFGMVAKTKRGSANVSRPRGESAKVVRSKRGSAKVVRPKHESGLTPDSQLLGLT
jgi:hypothetical protein